MSDLVPVPSEHAGEYARLLIEIETRKRVIGTLQTERDGLEMTLTNFAVELKSRVGGLRVELNRVKRQVAEYRRRIERLRESDLLDPEQVEREVAEEFAEQLEQERLAEEQAAREGQRIDVERPRPQLDAETEAEILRLYRELAKRFHPDRARTEEDRARRTDLMLRINVAYSERDLVTLQAMARRADTGESAAVLLSDEERVQWAHRVIARMILQITELSEQIEMLRRSETYQMWKSPEDSSQSIQQVERRVRDRLNRERDRLDEAIIDYNRIVRRRRLSHISVEREYAGSPGE
ncbi:MAG TPA: hypothetical protein VFI12_04700 [Thermomicrobiales bacterium]|jgi:hypothetical protein|nr:hypothetical protein [Thermomicrobiales bacterium]